MLGRESTKLGQQPPPVSTCLSGTSGFLYAISVYVTHDRREILHLLEVHYPPGVWRGLRHGFYLKHSAHR